MRPMSASRIAAWIVGLAVCTAWLASAAGVGRRAPSTRTIPRHESHSEMTALAADVQTQATRLRERMSRAPAPRSEGRNLFTFGALPRAHQRPAATASEPVPVAPPSPAPVPEPLLTLIGIAEMPGASGPVRTAMIAAAGGELLMATVGQNIAGRYEIGTIGADAVLLKDLSTGLSRTLVLR